MENSGRPYGGEKDGDSKSALGDLEKAFPKLQEQKIQTEAGMELIEIRTAAGDLDKAGPGPGKLKLRPLANSPSKHVKTAIFEGQCSSSFPITEPGSHLRPSQISEHWRRLLLISV